MHDRIKLSAAAAVLFLALRCDAANPVATPAPVTDAPPLTRVDRAEKAPLVKSARSGAWSDTNTWEGGKVPTTGDQVLIHAGHRVIYDVDSNQTLRYVHISGTLSFSPDRDTELNVGLLVVRTGEDEIAPADLVTFMAHGKGPGGQVAALEVGTADHPIDATHHATIRLHYLDGMDKNVCPAVIDSGARMDFHGAAMNTTWTKLKTQASAGDSSVTLSEVVTGWRVGDRIIVTTTKTPKMFDKNGVVPTVRTDSQTEQRLIKSIDGQVVKLDSPLGFDHLDDGDNHAEVANLSRNVIVESADPAGVRGHTMYHHGSTGSISYAEFRHLGKEGELGRYSLHFHMCGDSMRGSSIIGASIWDSANRWITIHNTNFMVVRDCVGYQSIGHGFFLEDGTEEYNVFDHNLAVQALHGQKLPEQILAFDNNDGAGFWWANSLNTFINNDAVECDQYGFRFEAGKAPAFNSTLSVRQPDGKRAPVDIRTLPFIRFENNEAHAQRRFALNLGGYRIVAGNDAYYGKNGPKGSDGTKTGTIPEMVYIGDVDGVGPDNKHPFVIKNFKAWATQWGFHSASPSVMIDGMDFYDVNYGLWRSRSDRQLYKNLTMKKMNVADVFYPWGGNENFSDVQKSFIKPVDDLPPATIITGIHRDILGTLEVTGTTEDNGTVTRVIVNGQPARTVAPNFATWEVQLSAGSTQISAQATDDAGNVELTPHMITYVEPADPTVSDATAAPMSAQLAVEAQSPATAVAKMEPATSAATQPVNQHVTGTVTFTATPSGVKFVADINGLEPNSQHVFHIHDAPDLTGADLLTAGKQWKPAVSAPSTQPATHLSSLGVLNADSNGHAHLERDIDGLTVTDGPDGILNHAVIIHANGPGKAGPRIAGGAIVLVARR